jgi:PAS domain S-box-containing protein
MENNSKQLNSIFEAILGIAQLDHSKQAILTDEGSQLDAIASGINMLSEELEAMVTLKTKVEQSEEKFRSLAESISDPYFAMDNDFKFLYWNKASEKLTGVKAEDSVGRSIYDVFPEIIGQPIETHYKEALITKKPKTITKLRQFENNVNRYFELSIYPTSNGISVISKDVTEKIQSEKKIKELNETLEKKVEERTKKIIEYADKIEIAQKASGIALWEWDLVTGKRELDDASYKLYQEDRESFDGSYEAWRSKVHKDDIERIENDTKRGLESLSGFTSEFRIIRPSGEIRHVSSRISIFKDENNKPIKILGTNLDITDFKVIEENLKSSVESYRNLFETMSQGVTFQDVDGKIISVNPAAEKILGLSIEQMTGRKSIDPRWKAIHPDGSDFHGSTHPSMTALKTGKEVNNVIMGVFNPKIESYTWININAIPQFKAGQDKPLKVYVTFDDITEQVISQNKIRQSLKETTDYRSALDESNIVAITDQEGIITYANDNFIKISKFDREELIGQNHQLINSGYHSNQFFKELWETIANGKIWKGEIKNKDKTGKYYWVHTTIVPFLNEKGKPYQYVSIRSDITERKEHEELLEKQTSELKYANEELQAFSYSVSHDLKAPLRSLEGFSEALLENYKGKFDEDADRWLNFISSNAKKMNALINDMLDYSKVSRGDAAKNKVNMKLLAQESFENEKANYSNKKIVFHLEDLPHTFGDIPMLRQVWQNLISNALKYSSLKTNINITITATTENDFYVYSVKDNGAGFDEKYKDKLFGVFQRLHTTKEFEGTGVGLAIVKRIIQKHDGWIIAKSVIGEGSEFIFGIPTNKNQ